MSNISSVANHHPQAQHLAATKSSTPAATQAAAAKPAAQAAQAMPQDSVSVSPAGAQASQGKAPVAQDQNFPTYKAPGGR